MNDIPSLITKNDNNADKEWINYATNNRHNITLYIYQNNQILSKTFKGGNTNILIINHDQLYKNYLMKACNNLKVDYPNEKDLSYKRDYYLIRDADSLYFTGYFENYSKSRLNIKGRNAWLVEMFTNKLLLSLKSKNYSNNKKLLVPIYMFSEDLKCWCQLDIINFKWIYIMRTPRPSGKYLAFGTDPMSETAKIELSIL